jgi:DNA-binding transcriptional ArsR family regulator
MVAADQSILQLLGPPKQLELTTGNIARNTGLSRQHVTRRLKELVDHGLVEKHDEEGAAPFYSISTTGEQLLAGEIEPEDLNED